MQVELITNAGFIVTLCNQKTILCDPWLTNGIYGGAWWHSRPLRNAAQYRALVPNYIYVSRIHEDHCDPEALQHYVEAQPTVIIGALNNNALLNKLKSLGFKNIKQLPLSQLVDLGDFKAEILGPFAGSSSGQSDLLNFEIDTAILIEDTDGVRLFNANDNPIQIGNAVDIKHKYHKIDIAMLPVAGAGPYPHCFYNLTETEKLDAFSQMQECNIRRFVDVADTIDAVVTVPVGGDYMLAGSLFKHNKYVGKPSLEKINSVVQGFGENKKRILLDMREGNLIHYGSANNFYTYSTQDYSDYSNYYSDMASQALVYEKTAPISDLQNALNVAVKRVCDKRKYFGIELPLTVVVSAVNSSVSATFILNDAASAHHNHIIKFSLDPRVLSMVLRGEMSFNEVEIGSLVEIYRLGEYCPTLHTLMNFLQYKVDNG